MSTEANKFRPQLGDGTGAREVTPMPTPPPSPHAAAADAKANEMCKQFGQKELPASDSKRLRLLPGFTSVSDELSRGLAIDEAVRRAGVTGHLGVEAVPPVEVNAAKVRDQLAASVRKGDLTEAEAHVLWREGFGDRDPGSVSR